MTEMVKLILSRRFPFVTLADIALRIRVEELSQENDQLRARIVVAQQEKAQAQQLAEELRRQKDRLRMKIASMKQETEAQHKVQEILEAKLHAVREENDALKNGFKNLPKR